MTIDVGLTALILTCIWLLILLYVFRQFESKIAGLHRELREIKLATALRPIVDSTREIDEARITVRDGLNSIAAQLVIANRKLESLVSETRRITTKVPQ